MTQEISEIDALKKIDELLTMLSDEQRQRIFQFVVSKYNIDSPSSTPVVKDLRSSSQERNPSLTNKEMNIKQFLALKRPVGFYEQIVCLAYFLEKYDGMESFNTKDISKANTEARTPKIPNPSLYVSHTQATYGFLSPVGSGKKALSARGEALVEALPDREAVKSVLENHQVKKKTKKSK
jgi:hypothetical protein